MPAKSLPDLHRIVPVFSSGLVRNDLVAVELEDGDGGARAGLRVEDGGHALFDAEGAGAREERVGFAEEGVRGVRGQDLAGAAVVVEAVYVLAGGGDGADEARLLVENNGFGGGCGGAAEKGSGLF